MIEIKNQRYEDYMNTILDNSIDFVYIDPPFVKKDGTGEVLKGHKIQTKINLDNVNEQAFRVLKDNSFYAISGKMPSIIDWHLSALEAGFEFKKDIVWSKGKGNIRQKKQLEYIHELIYIYSKGKPKYNKVEDKYNKIAKQLTKAGLMKIDSVFKYLSYWKGIAEGKDLVSIPNGKRERNDKIYKRKFNKEVSKQNLGKTNVNIKTIWNFPAHNMEHRNPLTGQIKHPTVKSIKLLERLIKLCTPEPTKEYKPIVCDYFLGSGTTAIASVNTSRDFKGCEIDKIYYETEIIPRVNKAIQKHNSDIFKSADFGVMSYL